LLAGLLVPQLVLLGSSLWGGSILLPLDILEGENVYMPRGPAAAELPKDSYQADLVFQAEVFRRLVVDEVRAGRLPLWNPYNYCGHPLLAANQPQVFSPYRLVDYAWASPVALAWEAVLRAVVGGIGAYLFFRRAAGVHWIAAVVPAWGFPLIGTMVLSGGYPGAATVSFLPWVLLSADAIVRRPGGRTVLGLSVATAFTLLAGHAAFAGQVLLVGGFYFLARLLALVGLRGFCGRPVLRPIAAGVMGAGLGLLLSAPQTLPTLDYLRSSSRIAHREATGEETPPSGPTALLQMVLPYAFGSTQRGTQYIGGAGNRIESAAGGYAGLLFTVVLAPLGWIGRRRRWMGFWTLVVVLAVTPTVGIAGIELLFRVPPVSLLRNNRLVFAAAMAVLAMASVGIDALFARPEDPRRPTALACAAAGCATALALLLWCLYRVAATPLDDLTGSAGMNPFVLLWPDAWAAAGGEDAANWFGFMYRNGVLLCGLALALAIAIPVIVSGDGGRWRRPVFAAFALGGLAVAEMTSMAAGVNVRADPALYYPRLPWMDVVAASPGRICGVGYLPANLNLAHRQADIRGYDAADPLPIVELLQLARRPTQAVWPPWAVTQFMSVDPSGHNPVANLLGVTYMVGRSSPPAGSNVVRAGLDYWIVRNPRALPRVTLPRFAKVLPDPAARLAALASATFNPANDVVLEVEPGGTAVGAEGSARIVEDLPCRVRIEVDLSRGGLVRLADAWDAGCRATYDGRPLDVLRADHALRAVVVPAGRGTILFEYAPASFRWGLVLCLIGACGTAASRVLWRDRSA
jgi:hypothetical protein